MSLERLSAPELLGKNKFNLDEGEAHIILDKAICATCQEKPCLYVCAAVLYQLDKNGDIAFDCAGCLECGTCRLMCKKKGITKWDYPSGAYGVIYRCG